MRGSKKEVALARLQKACSAIAHLKELDRKAPVFLRWCRDTELAVENSFTEGKGHAEEFRQSLIVWQGMASFDETESVRSSRDREAYLEGLRNAEALLESMMDEVREYSDDSDEAEQFVDSRDAVADGSEHKVFLAHGRDRGARETVARFLEKLGLVPVVLAEIPGMGRTIIEKFEAHSHVRFAVVLLTPDDSGSLQGGDREARPRARQNVIFELGFFVGRLGRGAVCALTAGEVEIPSDYAGVEYIEFDDGDGWKGKLGRELETAGLAVDGKTAWKA